MKYFVKDNSGNHPSETVSDGRGGDRIRTGDLVKQAAGRGANAVCILEYNGVTGFPEAFDTCRKLGRAGDPITLVYGAVFDTTDPAAGFAGLIPINQNGVTALYRFITKAYSEYASGSNAEPKVQVCEIEQTVKESDGDLVSIRMADIDELLTDHNLNVIADLARGIRPWPAGQFRPHLESEFSSLVEKVYKNARYSYGDPLPESVRNRLKTEIEKIYSNGYAPFFVVALKFAEDYMPESMPHGFRGLLGSSLVAFLLEITDIDPLPPHYFCPQCGRFHMPSQGSEYKTGLDLPDMKCPVCGEVMEKDGFGIPTETLYGYYWDREPAIFFNIPPAARRAALNMLAEMFGEENVLLGGSGTPGGIHPGAVLIVPPGVDINQFTPLMPARDKNLRNFKVTQLSCLGLDIPFLRIDFLGYEQMQNLFDLQFGSEKLYTDLPENAAEVLKLFEPGADRTGIPDFGTEFAEEIIRLTRPETVDDLIRLSGLMHGTGAWLGNGENLIKSGTAGLRDLITCRDDILEYLTEKGLDRKDAYDIMTLVRKGRPLKPEMISLMKINDVPDWYIESMSKIRYLFPRGHAAEYVMTALRLAWFKIHRPELFRQFVLKQKD